MSPPLEPLIKDQRETRVSEGHVNTRFFIISDIHTDVFKPEEAPEGNVAAVDVVICCGDLTVNSELREYRKVIDTLSKVAAPLKLVIAGNHDGTLDSEGFWDPTNWRYKRWPRGNMVYETKLFGTPGESRRLLERDGFIVLDEGHHRFLLGNGAELNVYASPATPNRSSRYKALQYKKGEGHRFSIGQDTDVVITHGPPNGILDPSPEGAKYRGCEDLFNAISSARPRLHCFGHNHGGWGVTFVEWQHEVDGEQLKNKESTMTHKKELMSLEDINPAAYGTTSWSKIHAVRRTRRQLEETRCVPTSHCAGDTSFVKKGEQTLFVNASWSKIDKHDTEPYTQWPWLVDIELPRQQGTVRSANADDAANVQTLIIPEDGAEVSTTEKISAKGCPLVTEQISPLQETTEQKADLRKRLHSGDGSSPKEKVNRGIYGFQNQTRTMELSTWRKPTTEAEQPTGDKAGLKTSWRPKRDETQPSLVENPVNKKYGFSKGQGRVTSGLWRQGSSDDREGLFAHLARPAKVKA